MSDEDDVDEHAELDDDFYEEDDVEISQITVDEALDLNQQRRSSRQLLEDILEQKKLRQSLDDLFSV